MESKRPSRFTKLVRQVENRVFCAREPQHQVLRPLEAKAPINDRKADNAAAGCCSRASSLPTWNVPVGAGFSGARDICQADRAPGRSRICVATRLQREQVDRTSLVAPNESMTLLQPGLERV